MDTTAFQPYQDVPIYALNSSCRRQLSARLNEDLPIPSSEGYPRNWEGLAELIGLQFSRIRCMSKKQDPTACLIEYWEEQRGATIGKLWQHLATLERCDVQEDIWPFIKRDGDKFLSTIEEEQQRFKASNPVQDPQVSSGDTVKYTLTIDDGDIMGISASQYDAYVSYCDLDLDFVLRVAQKLETEFQLKLFIKERDLLPGLVETDAVIRMMRERCKRILIILSPEFLEDPQCEFQTVFAQALQVENSMYARKVIPVICRPCILPFRYRFLTTLDYTKQDMFGSFWVRLYGSLTKPIDADGTSASLPVPTISMTQTGYNGSCPYPPYLMDTEVIPMQANVRTGSWQELPTGKRLSPDISLDSGISSGMVTGRSVSTSDVTINETDKPQTLLTDFPRPKSMTSPLPTRKPRKGFSFGRFTKKNHNLT